MRRFFQRSWRRVGAALLVAVLLVPVKVTCYALGASCVTAPDASGTYYTGYDIEPLTIVLIEAVVQVDLPLRYFRGSDATKLQR